MAVRNNFQPGEVLLSADMNDTFGSKGDINTNGAWTGYTPVLTASTTNPTLGSGSFASGAYMQIGRTVHFRAQIQFGTSGTNAGSGFYFVSFPVATSTGIPGFTPIANVFMVQNSTGIRLLGSGCLNDVNKFFIQYQTNSSGTNAVTEGVPWAWTTQDSILVSGTYQAAA
jgi:hypothetical protein